MNQTVDEILAKSGIAFGTSGARGLVTDFTSDVSAAFVQSFITHLRQSFDFSRVAIGIDNRPSSPDIAAACIGMLKSLGSQVDYYGVLPTPALALKAMIDKIPAIMVTGSHIPFNRNGIKFYKPDGEITKFDEASILKISDTLLPFDSEMIEAKANAIDEYKNRYLSIYPHDMLNGKHIGIYEHSSAGREIYFQVFEALGAKVTRLERSDSFVPIDTEAVSEEDQQKALNWSLEYDFDFIFTTDGDGDRPLIADENGSWLRGDTVGLLCAWALNIDGLAIPISCNTAAEKSGFFTKVLRTRIGSPYVLSGFTDLLEEKSYAGYEANGGFILGSDIYINGHLLKALPTRDALLPILAILSKNTPISELVENLPRRFTASDRLLNVSVDQYKLLLNNFISNPLLLKQVLKLESKTISRVDETDGVRVLLDDGDIIHLRLSGNAPELRCYTESSDEKKAQQLIKRTLININNYANFL